MRMYDIITKKKHGEELTDGEIRFFVDGYTRGEIPDYQASALLMAICLCDMSDRETATLTDAMSRSGEMLDLSEFGTLSVDKHSTGGVGDKTTMIVAPIVAAAGARVAKMSGRGLGHTGGTVDKLESFPGYRTSLPPEEFMAQVRRIGISVIGQSGNLAPADKKIYALRDVTATVDSVPLITSSIMSKKLAAGTHSIVLDVKCGSGSFMKTPEDAERLARSMVRIGKLCGRRVAALITDMDIPLGKAVGNISEVREAIATLRGEGEPDLCEVCLSLSAAMLHLALGLTAEEARDKAEETLASGAAYRKFCEWIEAQGGDATLCTHPEKFPVAKYRREVKAARGGYITHMDTERIGLTGVTLGAGRARKEDAIDLTAGISIEKKRGDSVAAGDTLAVLFTSDEGRLSAAEAEYLAALTIGDSAPGHIPLVYKMITSEE